MLTNIFKLSLFPVLAVLAGPSTDESVDVSQFAFKDEHRINVKHSPLMPEQPGSTLTFCAGNEDGSDIKYFEQTPQSAKNLKYCVFAWTNTGCRDGRSVPVSYTQEVFTEDYEYTFPIGIKSAMVKLGACRDEDFDSA